MLRQYVRGTAFRVVLLARPLEVASQEEASQQYQRDWKEPGHRDQRERMNHLNYRQDAGYQKDESDQWSYFDYRALELFFVSSRALAGRYCLSSPVRIKDRADVESHTRQSEYTRKHMKMRQLKSADNRAEVYNRFKVLTVVHRTQPRYQTKQSSHRRFGGTG